ncbi:tripartite tricarboxylate transporter substrate binding protein [Hydrogenophaga sp.]|uniref:Bug family tripartite tricarboxylate transporter substrate binding protein n=1 Tax=Hydrogenophaga sp. TaxID=1904254 RepID=UPI00271BCA01|nr:tripartite tricarboxylate transporter substrate binding protein [Hydrogenophaga sp.]MDO9439170.1 tripartite tricarboxylate transporter substrate binding protein [Hydrogenophaga sp.]
MTHLPPLSCVSRRHLLMWAAAAGLAPLPALGQAFPSKPIRIVTGFPGGDVDTSARLVARALAEVLNGTVIVDTKPGASGVIATDHVAKAAGDGYTLLVATPSSVLVAPQTMEKSTFNPLTDLKGINLISKAPLAIVVNPKLGITRMKDLAALSRTRPVTMGTNGLGTSLHVLVESLNQVYNANFKVVPYRSSAQSAVDAIAGHIDGAVSTLPALVPLHEKGQLLLIGVTSPKRVSILPSVPAIAEDVAGFEMENWMGVFAPGSTPPALLESLNAALVKAMAREDVRAQLVNSGTTPVNMANSAEFQKFAAAEYQRFGKVIKERNIVAKE